MTGIPAVFGATCINSDRAFTSAEQLPELFGILRAGGCTATDTASLYGEREELLGLAGVGEHFTIDTKCKGGWKPGYGSRENVIKDAENSRKMLGCTVDVFYIHAPDMEHTSLEELLEGVNKVYKTGFFERFGVSNFKAEDTQKVYDTCKMKGYPLPEVYEGSYSLITRKQETHLFPTLRKLNMAFYAYSPLAGGFLTKPSYLDALEMWEKAEADEGIGRAELAYRWVSWNSPLKREYGDKILYSESTYAQAKETSEFITAGPLSEKAVQEAPLDNYHR